MFNDPLLARYVVLLVLAVWGTLGVIAVGRSLLAYLLGAGLIAAVFWVALGTGFSIRLPSVHERMEVIVYTTWNNRVHALARPLEGSGEPRHIVFSIDPDTPSGARMRKGFYDAVRRREGKRHQTPIIVNLRHYSIEQGVYKYQTAPSPPPKQLPRREH